MRQALAASLVALVVLFAGATDVHAGTSQSYLAYQVRLLRGESFYRLDSGLSRLAMQRAREYALNTDRANTPHRALSEVPCRWGEVLGWSVQSRVPATRWVAQAWRQSTTHWSVIRTSWRHYGVGAFYRAGAWYFAVVFASCRL